MMDAASTLTRRREIFVEKGSLGLMSMRERAEQPEAASTYGRRLARVPRYLPYFRSGSNKHRSRAMSRLLAKTPLDHRTAI